MTKKLLTLLLAVAASVGTMFASTKIGNLYYILNATNQTAEVTSQKSNYPYWSTTITTANIPSSVTCNSVTYSVTSIGVYAFYECYGLTSVTIPNSVTSIGDKAFLDCSSLTSVTIPNSVTSIGSYAFYHCYRLTSVMIGNSVTSIGNGAFEGCSSLTSVTIPNSVTSIGWNAFYGCESLTSVTIPGSVTSIGQLAFSGCTGLKSVNILNSIIGDYAFSGCTGLTSVTIPNSVTSIGGAAFEDCSGLTSINVASDNSNYCSVDGVLFNKDKTTLIQYPGGKQGAYTIPNSVTSIGDGAFEDCTGLTSVTIPNSVTSIGEGAFAGCTGLTSVTCFATTPLQSVYCWVFYRVDKSIPIYVPAGSVSAYKSAEEWKYFTNILPIGAQPADVTTTTVTPSAMTAEIAWLQVSGAFSYELVIKDASGNTICTLVFNAQGQLISIKAPARENAEQQTQSAGFAFTVNGLEPGTQYNYSIIAKNESGATLKTETGTFTTKSLEGIENVNQQSTIKNKKLLRNGQVLIQKGDKTYTLTGQQLK